MARTGRRTIRFFLLVLVPLLVLAAAAYVYTVTGRYVTTENAYVKANKIAISADISGRVTGVMVGDNQFVKAGQQLFQIDPSAYRIALDEASAELANVTRRVGALRADYYVAIAELQEAQARLDYLDVQFARYRDLSAKGIATTAKFEEIEQDRAMAGERLSAIRQRIDKVLVSLGGDVNTPVEEHPWYLQAKAVHDRAALELSYTLVVAPVDGYVSAMKLEEGEYIEEGEPIFLVVESQNPWVEANLKETQLTHVVVGQEVTFTVDAYPNVTWRATVESISPVTGAEHAILPPQNASGNWVKVVQRIPVRLAIAPDQSGPALRPGMTASVSIDTRRERDLLSLYASAMAFVRNGSAVD